MKTSLVIIGILALVFCVQPARSQNPGDSIFAGIQVHTINLRFPQARYWDSLTTYYSQGNEQYMVVQAIINGVVYDSIGVRLKGNASYTHPNNKKPFRLSFDQYRSDLRWNGLKGVHLNNCWGDPTFMREKIHLDFCRDAGVIAPRGNFVQLSINDTLFAFYSLVEHVDKRFLGSHYADDEGDLFKAVDGFGGGTPVLSDFTWLGSDSTLYLPNYELKTDGSTTAWRKLVTLIDTLNHSATPETSLPLTIDLPPLYRAVATDNLFASLDSYINSGRNFYFYFRPLTGKMEWIVWDAGLSFGAYTGGVSGMTSLSLTYVVGASTRPLVGKIMTTPALKNAYLRTYCSLYKGYFSSAQLFPHIDSIANIIRPYVTADPRKMYTVQQFETNIVSDINASGGGGTLKPGLKAFINARQTNVQNQLTALGISCEQPLTAGDVVINEFMAQNDSILDPAGEAEDWIELFNNTSDTLNLNSAYLSDDAAQPAKWQFPAGTTINPHGYLIVWADEDSGQAGLHANFKLSANGEHLRLSNFDLSVVDSLTFGLQTANRSMARIPNGTGSFVQGRPTFNANNGSSVVINPHDVVINEFMAQNDSIPDPAGEFEDWIELYNNTSQAIALGGMYLSDAYSQPTKWQFPSGTTIGANSYVIVWADEDSGQAGVHANFKLSLSGEQLMLSRSDLTILDSTTFGQQIANRSMARIPNGAGAFVQGNHTFNANNSGNALAPMAVVINEFMADNDSIPDPAGETDDWIELYNNTTRTIDLGGLYLSDNFAAPTKWRFPAGATIAPNGYVIVWADQDTGQAGLHAMFALSASGERIILSNPDLTVVDSLTYAVQITNRSMSRIPNGTGSFVQTIVTFNGLNGTTGVEEQPNVPTQYGLEQNYPNPFNPTTSIGFGVRGLGFVSLKVYDLLGREVATLVNEMKNPGTYSVQWNATGIASGVYLYRLEAGGFVQTKKLVVLR
ncbi:MAG: lamin tail domain-containing protein [Ignavibacteriae bacterium]|nr:lamin tail domain-containing protein [Ignavibacteriota bacterium]